MKLRISGLHAVNLVLFLLLCVFLVLTGANIIKQADRQEKISVIVCYALFAILSMIIVSSRYYSRSHALKYIPKSSIPISSSDLPPNMFEHLHTQLVRSAETKASPVLDDYHMPLDWQIRSDKVYVECRRRCLELFSRLRELVEKAYPEQGLTHASTTQHLLLLKEKCRLDERTTRQLCSIYQKARYSHHSVTSADVNFTLSSLRSLVGG
jgi:hypothetical protein